MKKEYCDRQIGISVIMPVYNAGSYLKTAVDSILSQDFHSFELIIVDDGSTDGSSELCDQYKYKDERVVVIHQNNGGVCNARNKAIQISRGKYLAFADHDDEYLPDFLKDAYEEAVKNNADLLKVGKKEYLINNGRVNRTEEHSFPAGVYNRTDLQRLYFSLVDSRMMDCVWDGLYKKDVVDKNGIRFDESYKHGGEDIDFNQRILPYIKVMVTLDNVYYSHYIRKGFSTSSKFFVDTIQMINKKMEVMISTIQKLNIPVRNHEMDYTYFLFRQYVAVACAYYSNNQLDVTKRVRLDLIDQIRQKPFFEDFCFRQPSRIVFMRSKKYGILYFLFKHRFNRLIYWLFRQKFA